MKMTKAKINTLALRRCMLTERKNQVTLSKSAGISEATLSLIMKGKRNPSLETIQSIAQALNMSESEFYTVFNTKEESK